MKAGVVVPRRKHFPRTTTPSAAKRKLRCFSLMPLSPLLDRRGDSSLEVFGLLVQNHGRRDRASGPGGAILFYFAFRASVFEV